MKKIKYIILFLFFIFCIPSIAYAEEITCSDIRNKINEYNGIVDQYNSLVCDTVTDAVTFEECKNLVNSKNSIIEELFSMNDKNNDCNINELERIIDDNNDRCSGALSSNIKDIANDVMNFFYILAPFLLIIFGSIDFFKIIVNGDPKTIQKNRSNFIKRVIAFVLLYFTPFITKQILSLSVYDLTGNRYVCETEVMAPLSTNEQSSTILYSGVYGIDNSIIYDSDAAARIIKAADSISKTWARNNFVYFDDTHTLKSGNIKESINNPTKGTCCATLAAAALYKSNVIPESEINNIPYNGAYYIATLLDGKNWQIIESYNNLKPGDIVFMTSSGGNAPVTLRNGKTYDQGHVQIYAGGNKWYNAGSTEAIKGSQPSIQGDSYVRSRFSFAMRAISSNRRSRSNSTSNSTVTPSSTDSTNTKSTQTQSTTPSKDTNTKDTQTQTSTTKDTNTKDIQTQSTTSTKDTNTKSNTTSNSKKPATKANR